MKSVTIKVLIFLVMVWLCIQGSAQKKFEHKSSFQSDLDLDSDADDDEEDTGSDTEGRSQRPSVPTPTTPDEAASTPSPAACLPASSRRPRPHLLQPGSDEGRSDWRVRAEWLLERVGDNGGVVSGSVATISGGGRARAVRVLSTSSAGVPAKCDMGAGAATVTAAAAEHDCEVALSAAGCLGDLVSDGAEVRRAPGSVAAASAHFGITKAGEFFYGYLDDRLSQPGRFSQLVGGLGWLVRDGRNFVSETLLSECSPSRPLAELATAAAASSARSAVGQKRNGDLALVQIAGRSGLAGMNLSSFADLLIRLDLVSAINLEAGEATGMVVNGTLVGSPSASCGDDAASPLACLRPANAILCVVRRQRTKLSPPTTQATVPKPAAPLPLFNLSGVCPGGISGGDGTPCNPVGGLCEPETGRCLCRRYFTGSDCATPRCLCLNAGECLPGSESCLCRPGYTGQLCERPCPAGFYGQECRRVCVCGGDQSDTCDPINGTCYGGSSNKNESSLLLAVQRRLRGLGILNLTLVTLSGVLTLSLLFNAYLLVKCCRMQCGRGRNRGNNSGDGNGGSKTVGGKRYQPMRLVPTGRESDSDPESVM